MFPSYHLPAVRVRAFEQYGDKIQGDSEATAERAGAR
jgi:hypothetical protein